MVHRSSVLIVDRSAEYREVLRTALERRGVRIFEAARADAGLTLARRHRPEVVVLDLDLAAADETASPQDFANWANGGGYSLILLGTARRHATASPGEFIAKPYHYQPLVLKIEQLLQS